MPRYEFLCEQCKERFDRIMTISQRGTTTPHARSARAPRSGLNSVASWRRRRRRAEERRAAVERS
jgi:predicted nucleic acid-binding Zn ribbon protein